MNIQIFGKSKCFDTKKAERYFKERRIKYQYIDLNRYGISRGELQSVKNAVGLENLIDEKHPDAALLRYLALIVVAARTVYEEAAGAPIGLKLVGDGLHGLFVGHVAGHYAAGAAALVYRVGDLLELFSGAADERDLCALIGQILCYDGAERSARAGYNCYLAFKICVFHFDFSFLFIMYYNCASFFALPQHTAFTSSLSSSKEPGSSPRAAFSPAQPQKQRRK